MEPEQSQVGNTSVSRADAVARLVRTLDGLTDAVRELSWILLDRWKWQPVEEKTQQPTPLRSAGPATE